MEGKRDSWLNKPPTAGFWLVVIGIAVVIGAVFMINNSVGKHQDSLDKYCRNQAELQRSYGSAQADANWQKTCKDR